MKYARKLIIAIVLLGLGSAAVADNPFEPAYDKACAESNGATVASCRAWIEEMQQSPQGKSEDAQLIIGAAYVALEQFFDGDPQDKAMYRARAREIYAAVVKQNPKNSEAITGLANVADTEEERIAYLRQTVALNPTDYRSLALLAGALTHEGATPEQISEVADINGRVYANHLDNDAEKWRLASGAVFMYEQVGRHAEADAVRADARQRYHYDDVLARLSRPELMNTDELNSALTAICSDPVIFFGSAKDCLDGVKTVTNAVDRVPPNSAGKLSEAASLAMGTAANNIPVLLSEVDHGWQESFTGSLEKIITSGHATPTTFGAYGTLVPDRHKRLEVMEAGATKFPNDAGLAIAAGLAELDVGNHDDAVRNFRRAKELATEEQQAGIDRLIEKASKQ